MLKSVITRKSNVITATCHLPYGAYRALRQLALDHNAEIGETADRKLRLVFDEVETATAVADKFRTMYAEAHAAYVPKSERAPEPAPAQEPKAPKPTGKGNAKMTLNDFVIANPSCSKADAKAYGFKGTREDLKALKVKLGVR